MVLVAVACSASGDLIPVQSEISESQEHIPASGTEFNLVQVSNASQLKEALGNAMPGDSIVLAAGVYQGKFSLKNSGSSTAPIIVTGVGLEAVLDAGDFNTGYVFHLEANYCKIKNMTIQNGLKGVMADNSSNNVFEDLQIKDIGEEALHLRKFSKNNVVQKCTITNTGLKRPGYGEGIYIGTANSNWERYTEGLPDRCDSNRVVYNKIGPNITAECIDIKEGTSDGLIAHNEFYAEGISGENSADSWLDVKGNAYHIEHNKGYHDGANSNFLDGIQVNCAYESWGSYNIFSNNTLQVNASGYAINIRLKSSNGEAIGNIVYDTNTQEGAQSGLTNISITTP